MDTLHTLKPSDFTWYTELVSSIASSFAMSSSSSAMATPALASLGHTITEKLNRENFLVWRAQVLPHVRAAGMMGFLDGSQKEPDAEIRTERDVAGKKEVTVAANPEHAIWVTQDQQVLSFFIATLSREVLLQVSNCSTAAPLESFSSQSRTRIIQLREQISHTRKGDLSTAAYFTKMTGIAD